MKRIILVLCAVSALIVAQDAAGQYKLSGVDVLYTFVTRAENILTVTDAYGLGVTVAVATVSGVCGFRTFTSEFGSAVWLTPEHMVSSAKSVCSGLNLCTKAGA